MTHMSCGYAVGLTAPTGDQIKDHFEFSDSTFSWFGKIKSFLTTLLVKHKLSKISASILVVGQITGCLFGGPISDSLGRRKALILFGSLSSLGWITMAVAPNPAVLFIGRFLQVNMIYV